MSRDSVEKLQSKVTELKESPAKRRAWRRYICNRWTVEVEDAWIPMDDWDACPIEQSHSPGDQCWVGLDLAESGIGVSIVCPAWVRTNIHRSAFSKPSGGASESDPQFQAMNAIIEGGIDPDELGEWTSDCVEADRLYVFTHPAFSPALDLRYAQIKADYEAAAKHPPFLVKS